MRAAVFLENDAPLTIEDVTPIAPGPRDAVVRVTASGVCHSDLSVMNGTLPLAPPVILGHEGTGIVEAIGDEVHGVAVGDRVIGTFIPSCEICWFCTHGEAHLCERTFDVMGVPRAHRSDGAALTTMTGLGTFAETMTCDEMSLVKVASDLPDEQLALIGCGVTTGVGAVLNTAQVEAGSVVVVIGCGGVGQAAIQGARIAGAARIVAVDPVALKREKAQMLGATDVIDPSDADVVEQVKALTDGRGADYAFEVIGRPETILQAFQCVRHGGAAIAVGVPPFDASVSIPTFPLVLAEKRLLGCTYGSAQVRRDFPRLVKFVEDGQLDIGDMVTQTIALDDINTGFDAMKAGEVIRSVIV